MVENNDRHRTTNEWLQLIFQTNEEAHARIEAKLDKKVDKSFCQDVGNRREQRLDEIEKKYNKLAIKIATFVGGVFVIITILGWVFNK